MAKKPIIVNEEDQQEQEDNLVIDLTKIKEEMDANPSFQDGDIDAAFASVEQSEEDEDEDEPTKNKKVVDNEEDNESNEEQDEDGEEEEEDEEDKSTKTLTKSQKRIVELNAKKKAAEAANADLEKRYKDLENKFRSTQVDSSKRNYEATKQALEGQLELAEQEYTRAQNEGDNAASSKAISRMTMAQTQLVAIEAALENIKNTAANSEEEQKQQVNQAQPSEAAAKKLAAKWLRGNPRVYSDPKFGALVGQLTNQLIAEGDFTQDSPEYWEALDELITEVESVSSTTVKKKTTKNIVSGQQTTKSEITKNATKNSKNQVKLSPEQAATARNLGISYEDYALELQNETDFVIMPKRK